VPISDPEAREGTMTNGHLAALQSCSILTVLLTIIATMNPKGIFLHEIRNYGGFYTYHLV
jgi:hypothetical protein